MAQHSFNLNAYTRNQPEARLFQPPVQAKRDPISADKYVIGALWVNKTTNAAFLVTGYNTSGNPVWSNITGGAGSFSTLTVTTGPVTLPGPVFLYTGAGAPANGLALHVGDVYINTTAASAATRMYIATGVGAWTNITCAA